MCSLLGHVVVYSCGRVIEKSFDCVVIPHLLDHMTDVSNYYSVGLKC